MVLRSRGADDGVDIRLAGLEPVLVERGGAAARCGRAERVDDAVDEPPLFTRDDVDGTEIARARFADRLLRLAGSCMRAGGTLIVATGRT